jgi:hypothetical protein
MPYECGDRVVYVCIERKPEGHEVVTGTVTSNRSAVVYEAMRLYGGPVRVVAWSAASPELRAKAALADVTRHPVCAVCLSDLVRPAAASRKGRRR